MYAVKEKVYQDQGKPNPYEVAVEQFMVAADKLNLDEGMKQILSQPKRELTVHFPVQMDDGSSRCSPATACSTPSPRPGEGRYPLPPGRTLDEVKALAMWMTWKCAVGRHPVRRRQGWRDRRPEAVEPGRDRAAHPPLRRGDRPDDRARDRYPGARRQHQLPDDGLDHGHHLHDEGLPDPGSDHGQAYRRGRARWAATRPPLAVCSM